jgi:hypothetical protein
MKQNYYKNGFFAVNIGFARKLAQTRKKLISVFNEISELHSLGRIASDADVNEFYRGKYRDFWVAAYDQLRYLPEIAEISSDKALIKIAKTAGIKFPVHCARPILRADMPFDEKWEFLAHQDYVFNQGSLNSVTIWIPFQDTPVKLGAVQVIAGSHSAGSVSSRAGIINKINEAGFVSMPVKLGQVLVFSQFLHHRSGRNMGSGIRFSLQVRFNDLADKEYAGRKYYINQTVKEKTLNINFPAVFPKPKKA